MAFPDFPFPSEWNSFLSHQQVLKYLEDYASHFDLKRLYFRSSFANSELTPDIQKLSKVRSITLI